MIIIFITGVHYHCMNLKSILCITVLIQFIFLDVSFPCVNIGNDA